MKTKNTRTNTAKRARMSLTVEQLVDNALKHESLDAAVAAERAARCATEDYTTTFDAISDALHNERDRLLDRAKRIEALLGEHFGG